jgi:hypothetical protein
MRYAQLARTLLGSTSRAIEAWSAERATSERE